MSEAFPPGILNAKDEFELGDEKLVRQGVWDRVADVFEKSDRLKILDTTTDNCKVSNSEWKRLLDDSNQAVQMNMKNFAQTFACAAII